MQRGTELYNKHFRYMVRTGIACGLTHPIEWLIDYSRGTYVAYHEILIIEEFVAEAWKEFFELEHQREPYHTAEIQKWIDDYYKKPEVFCPNCNALMDIANSYANCEHCGYTTKKE